jgi:hypothetical protein
VPRSWRTALVACLIGAAACLGIGFSIPERGGDFTEFYAAGKLAGSGQLYNLPRVQEIERLHGDTEIPFGRLPFYAVLFKPLAALPYAWARLVWLIVNAIALAGFAAVWPVERRDRLAISLCWCCPAALLLSMGQDTALFLLFAALGFRLLHANRDFAAGLVFSLCAAKFHLALGIPVFLLARRRWVAVLAGAVGGLVQLAVSFAAEGREWPANLLRLSSVSEFSPAMPKMPNLLGLTHWLPHGIVIEASLALLVLCAVWLISRRSTSATGATAALIGGLLVSHHAYVYDCLLLLPALALAWQLPLPEVPRYWILLLWTPIPYVALMKDRLAVIAQVSISAFCLALLALLAASCLGMYVFRGRLAAPDPEAGAGARSPLSA